MAAAAVWPLWLVAAGTASPQPTGDAATPVRETVVVTATVAPETLGHLGRSVVLLTREDLARLPLASVADIFRLVASVDVRSRGPRGVQSDLSIRGASFGQALVLVNGVRLNDAQSGHHNADIPVTLDDVERVEVLLGGGSSLHGADAFGGTINVITRATGPRYYVDMAAGQHDLVEAGGTVGLVRGAASHRVSGEFGRASGFMPARDHDVRLARYEGRVGAATRFSLAHLDKEFGANGFYGPAPSREWTAQTLLTGEHRLADVGPWQVTAGGSYRTHADRFIYDTRNPALSDSRHRTHAVQAQGRGSRALTPHTDLSLGVEGGGDVIDSSNLGDHDVGRASAFAEVRQRIGARLVVHPGLRVDTYSRFGTSWSPAISAAGWAGDRVKWRASAGHAFRVPTFTELYYRDPNHQAQGDLLPERAWTGDGGLDVFAGLWTGGVTLFARRESDVIDWVRESPAERWRTTNVRSVRTRGLEVSGRRRLGKLAQAGVQYTWITSQATALDLLSKYVLDYAPHSLAVAASAGGRVLSAGARVEFKQRADGRDAWVIDVRLARPLGRVEVYADVANLLDTEYEEIRGVAMPGRWVKIGVRVR